MNKSTKILFCNMIVLCVAISAASAADLNIDSHEGEQGSAAVFTVSVSNAPNEADSFGFEVRYDAGVLSYRGYQPGSLTQSFTSLNVINTEFGVVRIGGFDIGKNKIAKGASGSLLVLSFEVAGHSDCELKIASLLDDFKNWTVKNGIFTGDHQSDDAEKSDNSEERTKLEDNTDESASDSGTGVSFLPPGWSKDGSGSPYYAPNPGPSFPGNNDNNDDKIPQAVTFPGNNKEQKKIENGFFNKSNASNIRKKQEKIALSESETDGNSETGLGESEKGQEALSGDQEKGNKELKGSAIYTNNNGDVYNTMIFFLILIFLVLLLILVIQVLILIKLAALKRSGKCK